ncbi:hypothetical protein CHS0354_022480 [Potamilus streckersoni]|nr:hypothetical protein CHS0354_022480 [Potamilus streckersoni]
MIQILLASLLLLTLLSKAVMAQTYPGSNQKEKEYDSYGASYQTEDGDWTGSRQGPDFFDSKLHSNETGYVRLDIQMRNMTRYKGENLRIRCEITGYPIPKYEWYKDQLPLPENGRDRISFKTTPWGSRLRIINLTPEDTGMYTCRAWNEYGDTNTTGALIIKDEFPPNTDAKDTDSLFPDGLPDHDFANQDGLKKEDVDSFYGKYDPDVLKRIYEESQKSDENDGFCQPFRGNTCAKLLGNRSIYVTSKYAQGLKEERFVAAFTVIASSNDLSKECHQFAIPSICYYAFPLCDESSGSPKPRQICRDECEVLENVICKREYIVAKQHPLIDNTVLPKCHELASRGTPDGDNCIRIGVPTKGYVTQPEETCVRDSGADYRGSVSTTRSGRTCKNWKNNPYFRTQEYQDLLGNHNFCRNPNNSLEGPWCFTDNIYQEKELCSIPMCETTSESSPKLMYIIPAVVVPLAFILLIAVVCFCQRHHKKNGKATAGKAPSVGRQQQNMELCALTAKSPNRIRDLPISSIRFLQELGEGAFGKVYKGEVIGLFGDNVVSKVAIKTLKENAAPKVQNDFRREVDLMSEMRHPNIVCLLGVSMKQEPMCMLFEYMSCGDLHEYLITHSPHSDISVSDDDGTQKAVLDYGDMLHIATQVAAGMEYLASHHFVHRDLAARNILVGENLTIKISDFGLSRDIYSSDYYRVQSKSLLPVRWMPPESIMYGKFSTESDVWSFGVVLWEIFSYGLQPYYGYSNQEVIEMIRSRQILPSPEDCPARMYGLMVECWHEMHTRRPAFREIHARLRAWKTEMLMQNPHWSLSQSHSAHSSSHQSSQSGPSHQGSTGPSNTTAVTGLTGSSNNSDPSQCGQMPPMGAPPHTLGHVIQPPMLPMQVNYMPNQTLVPQPVNFGGPTIMPNQKMVYNNMNMPAPNGPLKISPPESVSSGKSSSGSSVSNIKPAAHINTNNSSIPSNIHLPPPSYAMSSDCNRFNHFQNAYIPDQRTADI